MEAQETVSPAVFLKNMLLVIITVECKDYN